MSEGLPGRGPTAFSQALLVLRRSCVVKAKTMRSTPEAAMAVGPRPRSYVGFCLGTPTDLAGTAVPSKALDKASLLGYRALAAKGDTRLIWVSNGPWAAQL